MQNLMRSSDSNAPLLVPICAHGSPQAEIDLIVTLTRIMLIQAVVLGSGVIVGAVLNTKQDFTRTALGTVLYNVGLIAGLLPGFFIKTLWWRPKRLASEKEQEGQSSSFKFHIVLRFISCVWT